MEKIKRIVFFAFICALCVGTGYILGYSGRDGRAAADTIRARELVRELEAEQRRVAELEHRERERIEREAERLEREGRIIEETDRALGELGVLDRRSGDIYTYIEKKLDILENGYNSLRSERGGFNGGFNNEVE